MQKIKILIVEDESIIAISIKSSFQSLGYEVTSIVDTGEKAIEKAEKDRPDIILMDIRIKGEMDGIEAAEVIRSKFDIPVIFSTAYLDEERIERAKLTTPFGYVLKPIRKRDLKVTIEMALYALEVDKERKKSELMFSQLFSQSKTSTQLFNREGTCIRVNSQFCELFGVEAKEITDGRYNIFKDQAAKDSKVLPLIREIFDEQKTNKWIVNFDVAVASDSTGIPSTRKEKVWIDVLGYPILDSDGKLAYVIFQQNDITKRKQIEDALRENELFFSQMFEQSTTSTHLLNPEGYCTNVNSAFCKLYGISANDMTGGKYNIFKDQNLMSDRVTPLIMEIFDEKKPNSWEGLFDIAIVADMLDIPTTQREQVQLEVVGYPILESGGQLKYVVIQTYDITNRKRVEEEFRKSEEKYRELVQSSNSIIIKFSSNLEFTFSNKFAQEFFGYAEAELLGKNAIGTIIPSVESTGRNLDKMMKDLFLYPETFIDNENENMRKNGERVWVAWRNKGIYDSDGKLTGMLCVGYDITERKAAESALKKAKTELETRIEERTAEYKAATEEAERANRLKSEFLANMSHELRTPMHHILSYAQIGIKRFSNPADKHLVFFKNINSAGNRMIELVNNLLDLSKLEAGKMRYTFSENDIFALMNENLTRLSRQLEDKGISVDISQPKVPTKIICDELTIGQIFHNLLLNAIKFSENNRKISISFESKELSTSQRSADNPVILYLLVSIKDQGPGIPDDELDSIFDRFIQSSKTKTGAGGTGLGLAICQEIIKAHHGKIWAENNLEGGAKFSFELPYRQETEILDRR